MSYIFIEKTQIPKIIPQKQLGRRVLVVEPEADFLNLICHVLGRENFEVKPLLYFEKISTAMTEHQPEIVVISTSFLTHPEFGEFKKNSEFSQVKLISLGNLSEHENLRGVMNTGFSGHLDRKFSRPQDLVNLINCLLILN